MAYVYQPLPDTGCYTRLLLIHSGERNEDLRCKLLAANLDNEPEYAALSYCWGKSNHGKTIILDGQEFGVTDNLHSALCEVRDREHSLPLWVDAVCIDQSANIEKAAQVSIMMRIYSQASITFAWIGESLPESRFLFTYRLTREELQEWAAIDTSWSGIAYSLGSLMWKRWTARYRTSHVLTGTEMSNAAIKTVSREYFSRIWIVQELVVSQDVRVLCGQEAMNLVDFVDNVFILAHRVQSALHGTFSDPEKSGYTRFCSVIAASEAHSASTTGEALRLLPLLSRFRFFDSTNMADKLFALYGLAAADVTQLELYPNYFGDAYVHGIMSGEAWDESRCEKILLA